MRERLVIILEEMAVSADFDEKKYNEFSELLKQIQGDRGLLGVAADELAEYYACWRLNKRTIPDSDQEAIEIRSNLALLSRALRRDIKTFRSFKDLRKTLTKEDLGSRNRNEM